VNRAAGGRPADGGKSIQCKLPIEIESPLAPPYLLDMLQFSYNPPLPEKPSAEPFVQSIRLTDSGILLGQAQWHASSDGVAQILDLSIVPDHQRTGLGEQLLHALVTQARAFFRARRSPLRRLWVAVEQKSQVNARAFLTTHGFHHVATVQNLHKGQDTLIYTKAFD
jgi:GNAT superfamily N-acetyltransferase